MDNSKPIDLRDFPVKCVSCAYLCYTGRDYIGVSPRLSILKNESGPAEPRYDSLVCFKGILPSFYLTGWAKEDVRRRIIKEDCTRKKWKLFINGVTPVEAEQQEANKWSKRAFWAVVISIILAFIYFIVSNFVVC